MESAEHTEAHWQTFRSQPAAGVHPRRIVHAFDGLVSDDVASKLADDGRFRHRLSALLTETYRLSDDFGDDPPSAQSRRLALAASSDLMRLIRQFGAIYWARAIVGAIESSAVVALKQVLGDEAYAAALAQRDLAGPDSALPGREAPDPPVPSPGLSCLAAWCARQPPAIAQRIRLKLPDSAEQDGAVVPPFDEWGPRIVDRLMSQESGDA